MHLGPSLRIAGQGERSSILANPMRHEINSTTVLGKQTTSRKGRPPQNESEALVEMQGVQVRYGSKTVLGNWSKHESPKSRSGLWWSIKSGQRWGVFGPNGKLPLLSLRFPVAANLDQAQVKPP